MSIGSSNGHSSPDAKRFSGGASPTPSSPTVPLVDGAPVEITQHLITRVEGAGGAELPTLDPDDEVLAPAAEQMADEAVGEHVRNTLGSHTVIAASRRDAGTLRQACRQRRGEYSRRHGRLTARQDALPEKVPAGKPGVAPLGWARRIFAFWFNWGALGLTAFAAALGATVLVEVLYQVGGLRESSWGLVQSLFGAFGFCWSFTMAAVVATNWRRRTLSNADAHPLDRSMSRAAFQLAWWGLAGFGLMMGLMHSFEEGEGWLLPPLRCVLTTISVLSLGMICVAVEKAVEHLFHCAHSWTLVDNDQIDAMDEAIHPVTTQLMILDQIEDLARHVEERLERHIRSQQQRWLSRRDAIRMENQRGRDIAAEEQTILLAQQRLAGLRPTDAA